VITNGAAESSHSADEFATTRWSVVLSCADTDITADSAQTALAQLCQTYWRPIFTFIRRRGHSISDSQDMAQDFFLSVLGGKLLHRADPERGRFRTYLLHALKDFLNDAKDYRDAQKRGGNVQFVSWEEWMAETPSQLSIPEHILETWPAERLFDLRWAATVVERALRRLAEECEAQGRRRVFDALSAYLTVDRGDVPYVDLSKTFGKVPEATMRRLLHKLRERYRALLREELADTVENPAEIGDEVRYLCATLAAGASRAKEVTPGWHN
jgi:RNA polymerase sigma-70 factor (ECF subfamily)